MEKELLRSICKLLIKLGRAESLFKSACPLTHLIIVSTNRGGNVRPLY